MKPPVLLITFLLFLLCGVLWHNETVRRPEKTDSSYQDFFPESTEWQKHTTPFPYIEIRGPQRHLLGYIIRTDSLRLNITGYAGPTPLVLALSPDGTIVNLRALANNETSSYIGKPETFLKQFLGLKSDRTLKIGQEIDGISHATITSEAMSATIQESLKLFSIGILKQHGAPAPAKASLNWSRVIVPLVLLTLACSALLYANTVLRWITFISGFIYFGLMTQTMLSIVQVANIGLGNIPDFMNNPLWFMTLGIALGASLLIGRIYCGSLCPFAFVQEIFNKAVRRPRLPAKQIHHKARNLKYIFLFLILGICFVTGNPLAADMEPFVTLFAGQGTKLAWGLVGLMLTIGIFYHRFWCVYLCPVGAVTGLLAQISLFKIKAAPGCTQCGICSSRCPTRAIETTLPIKKPVERITIDASECILCGKCLQSCAGNHLKLKFCYHDRKR